MLDGKSAVAEGLRGADDPRKSMSADRSINGPGAKPGGAFRDRELANPVGAERIGSICE